MMKSSVVYFFFVLTIFVQLQGFSLENVQTHFWLYTKDSHGVHDYEVMHFDGEEVNLDENTKFDAAKPTKLVAHGLGGGTHIDHIFNQAYAKAGLDYNVIGIDWRDLQGGMAARLDLIGNHTARFLKGMSEDFGLQISDVHAIGFSYGTHVIGNTAKYVVQLGLSKIPRGTGLDTVGNLGFQDAKNYFEYVEAIHTSAPFGQTKQRGHIDFYPNGGSIQPCTCKNPCPDIDCNAHWQQKSDHKRAPALFEESILSADNFLSWRCDDLDLSPEAVNRSCPYNIEEIVPMGEWTTAYGRPEGIFYLTTKDQMPYSCP